MKYFPLWLLLVSLRCFAQEAEAFQIDSLPKQGILLDKDWKWHQGDNPEWAKADYDDSDWEKINPTQGIEDLNQVQKAGNGWFRLHFKVDSSLLNSVVSIMVMQVIASEIFLDGHLIATFGSVSMDSDKIQAFNPSGMPFAPSQIIHFKLGDKVEQMLSVRFAVEPSGYYVRLLSHNPCLKIRLNKADLMNRNSFESRGYLDVTFLDFFKAGLFFILTVLHLLFYFSFRAQKTNLYFGLVCLLATGIYLVQPICYQFVHKVSVRMYLVTADWLLFSGFELVLLTAVYSLFQYRKGSIFKILVILYVADFILFLRDIEWSLSIGFLLIILANLDATRISIIAFRAKKNGAWLIMAGTFGYAAFTLAYFITVNSANINYQSQIWEHIFANTSHLSIPISITLFLAREFAQTTNMLVVKLEEVETLSAQTIHIKNQLLDQAHRELALQRQMQEERERISRDLHDDVGSTLSSISILSESFLRNVEEALDKNRFGNIGEKARTALDSISDIVWSVNPNNDSIEKLLARMSAFASEMLENENTELLFQVGENMESMSLPMEKRKDFYLIFKEAIHNCAKYAQAKHIRIHLEVKNNTLLLNIKDDGIGFDPGKIENPSMGGNGLKNMQRRTAAIRGTFSIESSPGNGVALHVAVPLVP